MKEFIEKLIGRLEEYKYSHLIERNSEQCEHCKYIEDCENRDCSLCIWDKSIEIVNQLSEEYMTCYKSCTECEAYDKEKHYCPKWCEVIKHTTSELAEEYNNGWIPCSELPEENGMYLCTVFHADDYVVWIMRFNDGEFLKPDDVEDWNYELLAWMPIVPYQPKGE